MTWKMIVTQSEAALPAARHALGLHTPLCDLLGIQYPICQAGMGYVARCAAGPT